MWDWLVKTNWWNQADVKKKHPWIVLDFGICCGDARAQVGKLVQCWPSSCFPWILSKDISLLATKVQEADGSLPHLSTKQSLKHMVLCSCSGSVSHRGLKLLCWSFPSSCRFPTKTGLFIPSFPYQDISLTAAILFQLKGRPRDKARVSSPCSEANSVG